MNYPTSHKQKTEDLVVRVFLQYRPLCSLSLGIRAGGTLREVASKTSSVIQLATINILRYSVVMLDHQGCTL